MHCAVNVCVCAPECKNKSTLARLHILRPTADCIAFGVCVCVRRSFLWQINPILSLHILVRFIALLNCMLRRRLLLIPSFLRAFYVCLAEAEAEEEKRKKKNRTKTTEWEESFFLYDLFVYYIMFYVFIVVSTFFLSQNFITNFQSDANDLVGRGKHIGRQLAGTFDVGPANE